MAILVTAPFQNVKRSLPPRSLSRYFGPKTHSFLNVYIYQYKGAVVFADEKAARCLGDNLAKVEAFVSDFAGFSFWDTAKSHFRELPIAFIQSPDSKILTLIGLNPNDLLDINEMLKPVVEERAVMPISFTVDGIEGLLVTLKTHVHPSWATAFSCLSGDIETRRFADQLFHFENSHKKMRPTMTGEAIEHFRWGTFYSANEAMQVLRQAFNE